MSNNTQQLSKREQYMIESYKEQTAAWRHENNLLYRFTTILLPVSIAALGVPYVQPKVPDLLATVGGLTLMTFWAFSCQIIETKSKLRFSIINEIEKYWDIPSHNNLIARKKNTYGKKANRFLRSHFLRCCIFWVYLGIVAALTLYRQFGSTSTAKALICVPIDVLITVVFGCIAVGVVGWAMRQARKDICMESNDVTGLHGNGN